MNVAIFASGNGSNFQRITEYFADNKDINIALMVCNNPNAYVFERAKQLNIPTLLIDKATLKDQNAMLSNLEKYDIEFIILAGFLWLIPEYLTKRYQGMMVNIHPALLPKFGGKGMYGMHVHEAVISSQAKESGITIHYVNKKYDAGQIIAQIKCTISEGETAESLAEKIHQLEYEYYPKVLEKIIV